ncbi:MAG: WD40 repeat domain-containing protein [Planctomycetes bacterium]|nr:WD40 repeat domain-containing protein [Planctomycetota bacterium]
MRKFPLPATVFSASLLVLSACASVPPTERGGPAGDSRSTRADSSSDAPPLAWGGKDYAHPTLLRTMSTGDASVWAIAFSPDGSKLATGGDSGLVRVWRTADLLSPEPHAELQLDRHHGRVHDLQFDADGRRLISAGRDGQVIIWDLDRREPERVFAHAWEIRAAALSPDGTRLVTGQLGGTGGHQMSTVHVWDVESGARLQSLEHHAPCADLSFSPDGVMLALGLIDGEPSALVDVETWTDVLDLGPRRQWANRVIFDADGRHLALASVRSPLETTTVGSLRLWNARTGRELAPIEPPTGPVGLAFTPGRDAIAASLPDEKRIVIYDLESRTALAELPGRAYTSLSFHPEGWTLAACSPIDGRVDLWIFGADDSEPEASAEISPASAKP